MKKCAKLPNYSEWKDLEWRLVNRKQAFTAKKIIKLPLARYVVTLILEKNGTFGIVYGLKCMLKENCADEMQQKIFDFIER